VVLVIVSEFVWVEVVVSVTTEVVTVPVVSVMVVVALGKEVVVSVTVSTNVVGGGVAAVTVVVDVTMEVLQTGDGCHLTQSTPLGYLFALFGGGLKGLRF
jgi:hypothetical protein